MSMIRAMSICALAALLALALLAVAGCGGDSSIGEESSALTPVEQSTSTAVGMRHCLDAAGFSQLAVRDVSPAGRRFEAKLVLGLAPDGARVGVVLANDPYAAKEAAGALSALSRAEGEAISVNLTENPRVVVAFDRQASEEDRELISGCVEAG
jgi:hypothetical protein